MQKLLNKYNFKYYGIINLKNGSKKIAFEKNNIFIKFFYIGADDINGQNIFKNF